MIKFKEFMKDMISEKLITFGGKAYPKFGQVVILAGGAGSGKGFVMKNLIGIEGNTMDVDALKALAIGSDKFAKRVKEETGQDLKKFDLRQPENVSKLHELLSDVYGITKANERRIFSSALAAPSDRKPNLIFDVTLKDMSKLEKITRNVKELGYDKSNIHIVWVVNDVDVAVEQNKNRSRVVPHEILIATHEGASITMRKIVEADIKLTKYMDGDIWFAFNKAGVDTKLVKSELGGSYIADADYIQIKKKGKRPLNRDEIGQQIIQKISEYTPEIKPWI
ncbi:MAG: zeta toxin family protein [Nitrosopumilaceae archaeon]|nr:zeta toxin family protein [Nitrosopumilaceae archaeon]